MFDRRAGAGEPALRMKQKERFKMNTQSKSIGLLVFICFLIALCAFQSGFLFKAYLEYKTSAVPIVTMHDLQKMSKMSNG